MLVTSTGMLSSMNVVFGSTVTFAITKIKTKGTETLTKGYMLFGMKSTVLRYARNDSDSVLRD